MAANLAHALNTIVDACHAASVNAGWWTDPKTGRSLKPYGEVPLKLVLIHSEVSEALEGFRKDLMDDKLPHRSMLEVELADAVIRIADLAGALSLDLGGALVEKLGYNAQREDHKIEARKQPNGKRF